MVYIKDIKKTDKDLPIIKTNKQISLENLNKEDNKEKSKEKNDIIFQYLNENLINLSLNDISDKDDNEQSEIDESEYIPYKSKNISNQINDNLQKINNNNTENSKKK